MIGRTIALFTKFFNKAYFALVKLSIVRRGCIVRKSAVFGSLHTHPV